MKKSKIFLFCLINFIVGVAIASFLPLAVLEYDVWFFAGFISFLILTFVFSKKIAHSMEYSMEYSNPLRLRSIFLFLAFLFLGFWRLSISLPAEGPSVIRYYNGEQVKFAGVLRSEPDRRDNNQKIEVEVEKLFQDGEKERLVKGKVLVSAGLYPVYGYGDYLEIECELSAPEKFDDFSYDRYLAKFGIYSVCSWPKISVLETGRGNFFYNSVLKLKSRFSYLMNSGMDEPESTLARAMILGEQKNIPPEITKTFSISGLSHIISISGLHISIFSTALLMLLINAGLWRKQAFYAVLVFIILYIILVGAPASAVRSGLMGFLALLALNFGRLNAAANSISLAAAVLLFANPKLLRDDIGFQLSFLAVIGIVYFYPRLEIVLKKLRVTNFLSIRNIVSITLSAQILTWPILAFNFNQLSLIAPIANLAVLWSVPFLMASSILGLLTSLFLPQFSFIFLLPSGLVLKFIIKAAEIFSNIPYSSLNL